jgi:mono/diheme cytochrome c family protein
MMARARAAVPAGRFPASPPSRVASKTLMALGGAACCLTAFFVGLVPLEAQTPAPAAPASAPPAAPAPAAKPAAPRSVLDGVYTKEQAARGQKAYNSLCARCHGDSLLGGEEATPLVGQEFMTNWTAKSVGALLEYTRKEMPSDGPGKLTRQQSADATAYVFSVNGFPAGGTELSAEPEASNPILIQPKK